MNKITVPPVVFAVVNRDPRELKPRPNNPRTHSKKQLRQTAASISEFGFLSSVLIDANDMIIAGHARVEAAKLLGLQSVPTCEVTHLTEAQVRAFVIADNKIALNAGWDPKLLTLELREISIEANFDITITGFSVPEIDNIFGTLESEHEDDEIPAFDQSLPAVSRVGDLWHCGEHSIFCGDATKSDSYSRLLNGNTAQLVCIDPPYNVPVDGHVSGLGGNRHREFPMARGEMSRIQSTNFLKSSFSNLAAHSDDGALQYVFMDWRHMTEILSAGEQAYSEFKNLCVWNKMRGGMGSLYRSQHELVFVFKSGKAPHTNNIELGQHGRNRTNVWNCSGMSSFGKNRAAALALHPTVKPNALIADIILDASERGGIVLDVFGGSGTTLIAAHKCGRHGYIMELDPLYVDTILRRFLRTYNIEAILVETGQTFSEVASARRIHISDAKAEND
ncbi:MAG: DNA methyltransferase [Aestuariivirga sp.]